MKNTIRMDFYRLMHSKALMVGVIVSFFVTILGMLYHLGVIAIVKVALDTDPATADGLGLLVASASWINGVDFADIVLNGTGIFSLFIACMVSASFIGTEQSSGYVKNVIGQLPDRGYMVVSKFVTTSFIHLVTLIVYTIVSCVCAVLFFGAYINSWSIGYLVAGLCLRLLLYMAINAVIIFLCMLTKSSSLAMVIGAIFGIGITKVVYMIVGALLSAVNIDIDFSLYTPDGLNGLLTVSEIGNIYIRAVVVFVIFAVVFVGAAIALIKKRDVK